MGCSLFPKKLSYIDQRRSRKRILPMLQKPPIIIASLLAVVSVCGMAIAVVHQISTEQAQAKAYPKGEISYPFDGCYPSTFDRPIDVKQSKVGGVTWWEVKAKSVWFRNDEHLLHLRTEDKKCKWSNRNRPTFRLDYMPKTAAIDFAKQHYEPMLEHCKKVNSRQKDVNRFCIEDMQKGLQGSVFFPEEINALASISIDMKGVKDYQVISKSEDIK
jgi:hypothetical protein